MTKRLCTTLRKKNGRSENDFPPHCCTSFVRWHYGGKMVKKLCPLHGPTYRPCYPPFHTGFRVFHASRPLQLAFVDVSVTSWSNFIAIVVFPLCSISLRRAQSAFQARSLRATHMCRCMCTISFCLCLWRLYFGFVCWSRIGVLCLWVPGYLSSIMPTCASCKLHHAYFAADAKIALVNMTHNGGLPPTPYSTSTPSPFSTLPN